MKQRISPAQLAELSPEQQERLKAWWKPEPGDYCTMPDGIMLIDVVPPRETHIVSISDEKMLNIWVASFNPHCCGTVLAYKDNVLPLLSIGQCIGILGEKWFDHILFAEGEEYTHEIIKLYDGELIDALFAAVKEVL
jgi:hypothetical protein